MNKGPYLAQGRVAEIFAWGDQQVLKLFRSNNRAAAEHEARIARLAVAAGVKTPRVYDLVEVEGRPGIIYERIHGPSMLAILATQPWRLFALARLLAEVQATLHQCVIPELPSMREALQRDIQANAHLPADLRQATLAGLHQLPDDDKLCHGDFHPDNLIIGLNGVVVIDWPNAKRGCPLADVARTAVILQTGPLPATLSPAKRVALTLARALFRSAYLQRYFQISSLSRQQLPNWEVPLAAARLNEGIAGEQAALLKIIKTRLNKKGFFHANRQPT